MTATASTRDWVERLQSQRKALCVSLGLVGLSACAATPPPAPPPAPRPTRAADLVATDPRAVSVWDGRSGEQLSWNELVRRAGAAEVVLIGENHGHPLGLACAAALFEDLVAEHDCAALAHEFIERDEQSRLDDWLSGLCDEKTFIARTQRSNGNYPDGHRAMIHTAKAASRPVIAANAPRTYVRLAREQGYTKLSTLTAEQQRLFQLPYWLLDGRYRAEFDHFMAGNWGPYEAAEKARLDSVFRSQSLWDWTMADSLGDALERGYQPLVHVVGRFHVDHEGGTVQALRIRCPGVRTFVISFINESAAEWRPEDQGIADAVLYVGPAKP